MTSWGKLFRGTARLLPRRSGEIGTDQQLQKRVWIIAAVVIALLSDLWWLWFSEYNPVALDFRVFWLVGQTDLADIYGFQGQSPFVYPPTAIPWLVPLAAFPFWTGYMGWSIVSICLFYFAVQRNGGSQIALMSFLSAAAFQGLALGQTAMIAAAIILLAFSVRGLVGGILLGLVATIKPQLLIMLPLALLIKRDWPMLLGAVVAAVLALVVQLALYGAQPWIDWLTALPSFRQTLSAHDVLDDTVTPAAFAERIGLPSVPFLVAGAAIGTLAVVRNAREYEGADLAALIVAGSLLASPYALTHDALALIPAILIALLRNPNWKMAPAITIFSGLLVPFILIGWAAWAALWPKLRNNGRDVH